MVNPARIITLVAAINQLSAVQTKEKRMVRIVRIQAETFLGLLFSNALSRVFNDASASGNFACREHTVAMDG